MLAGGNLRLGYWMRRRWAGVWPLFVVSLWYRALGYRVAHIHWPAFYLARSMKWKRISYLMTRTVMLWLDKLGYKIVWTVHNVVPHERQTSDDTAIAVEMSRRAVAVICHSQSSLEDLATVGGRVDRAVLIPHGNYIGMYPASPVDCRYQNDAGPTTRVFLFFGKVRPYKGVDRLADHLDCLGPTDQLWIVGQGHTEPDLLSELSSRDPRMKRFDTHVADSEVEGWFRAADIVCLPFTSVTTSGSAVLALSFGKPLIAPRLGDLRDLPAEVGFFYDPTDPQGLCAALRTASSAERNTLETMSAAARELAEQWSWDEIANKTWSIYISL